MFIIGIGTFGLLLLFRVIHMSSGLGNLTYLSKAMQDRIMSPDLTVEGLSDIMDQFVK